MICSLSDYEAKTDANNGSSGSGSFPVNFFQLNPGERAIVRVLVDSESDMQVRTVHRVSDPSGKFRLIDCLRDLRDPLEKCPCCATGNQVQQVIYLRLLQYTPDGNGGYKVESKIWGRHPSSKIVKKIKSALSNYGALSNVISSITRTGSGKQTDWDLNVNLPADMFPQQQFPLDKSNFEGYSEAFVRQLTAQEMVTFLATGALPTTGTNQTVPQFNPATAQRAYDMNTQVPVQNIAPISATPIMDNAQVPNFTQAPPIYTMPNGFNEGNTMNPLGASAVARPVRYN